MKTTVSLLTIAGVLSVAMSAYNETLGFRALHYSGATHCNETSLESWTCGEACINLPGTTDVKVVKDNTASIYGLTGYNSGEDYVVIVFRGSVDVDNWLTNINYFQTDYPPVPGSRVHEGFYSAYLEVADQVRNNTKELLENHPSATIFVTGHSLGAALATLAALDIKQQNYSNPFVFYTLGSPRVGDKNFSNYLMTQFPEYSRITHYDDIVVHLPTDYMGFIHGGNEVWYNHTGADLGYKVCSPSVGNWETWDCSNSLLIAASASNHKLYLGKWVGQMCDGYAKPTAPTNNTVSTQTLFLSE